MSARKTPALRWLCMGLEIFPAMLAAIGATQKSIQLETYTYSDGRVGRQFLQALLAATRRGGRIRVLVDAGGSWFLPDIFLNRSSPPVRKCAVSIHFTSGASVCVTIAS